MAHVVTFEDLLGYSSEVALFSCHGRGESKSLMMKTTVNGRDSVAVEYIVYEQGEAILFTGSLEEAIESYNSAY